MTRVRNHPMAALGVLVLGLWSAFACGPRRAVVVLREEEAAVA